MLNNRMLAVAAVLVMAVPALGAATPIVVPPTPEQLVEGHTVFTVIEIAKRNETQTNETRFAAAVAVLVREYVREDVLRNQRFPGVLWFNDQYLVNPTQNAANNADVSYRYPCGGAVMAVNRGDPDPRMVMARIQTGNPEISVGGNTVVPAGTVPGASFQQGYSNASYDDYDTPADGTYAYGDGNNPGADGVYGTADDSSETDYAWIGTSPSDGTVDIDPANGGVTTTGVMAWSDTVIGSSPFGADYVESYLITDPNDHSWIIDKYQFYTRDTNQNVQLLPGNTQDVVYAYPVWVVNLLGQPVFIPDHAPVAGVVTNDCAPFRDLIAAADPVWDTTCGVGGQTPANADVIKPNFGNEDDPCMGYEEVSRNGFCYGGQQPEAQTTPPDPTVPCSHVAEGRNVRGNPNEPLRQYNALLYFKLEDLHVFGAPRDHCNWNADIDGAGPGTAGGCDPSLSGDTNGCSEEHGAVPGSSEDWPCPTDTGAAGANGEATCTPGSSAAPGNDDCEGDSHPFHPTTPPHNVAEECLPQFYYSEHNGRDQAARDAADGSRANPTNHGGSSYITPTTGVENGWYQMTAPCDYLHATRNIDIYYSGGGRPFAPAMRSWDVMDLEGSSAPFHDYHCAYEPGTYPCGPPESAPGILDGVGP